MADAKRVGNTGKKILIVDDDFSDLRTMKMALEKEGFSVYAASDGKQANDIMEKEKFSLILLDIRMPEISGYELLRLFRQRLDGGAKIVFVSIVPKSEVNLADADGFVQKPFNPKTLVSEVKKLLG